MKKLISVVLVLAMLFAVAAPMSVSAVEKENLPIIYIRGNGELLYNADGKKIAAEFGDAFGGDSDDGGVSTDALIESCANILLPFVFEGLIFDKWDTYGKKLYEEIVPLFEEALLDGNGDPKYGTGVHPSVLAQSEAAAKRNWGASHTFAFGDYDFVYDWRLSPYDHVDRLHQYIETILAATGKKQVNIIARCFGGSLLMAYLEKYGEVGYVKNAVFCEVLMNGTATISKAFSGKVEFDSAAVQRYMGQLDYLGDLGAGQGLALSALADEIISEVLDLLHQVGAIDGIIGGVDALYEKLYKALMPAICFASGMATQANYWTCVYAEDFDDALALMFGEEGSEARTAYAGLLEKIKYYREHVTDRLEELYDKFENEYGIHVGVIAKYGYVNAPFTEGLYDPSDALVSLVSASFGATVADINKVLSEDYLNEQIAAGKGAYISADKMVDTSTAAFPETTWVIKNSHHDLFTLSCQIATEFCRSTNLTVEESSYSRFMMYDEMTGAWEAMTESNCAPYPFIQAPVENPTEGSQFIAFFRLLETVIRLILDWFKDLFAIG